MREILFKGKRKDNGEWIEDFYARLYDDVVVDYLNAMARTRAKEKEKEKGGAEG